MNKLLQAAACLLLAAAGWSAGSGRPPAVAGNFYPAEPKALNNLMRHFLEEKAPPLPGEPLALLVPHAALEFSGRTLAKAYKSLGGRNWDAVIVLGTGHYKALEGAALYPGPYATPEGAIPYDAELARDLLAAGPWIVADASAHRKEHSVEVQLPYIRRLLPGAKLVALVANTQDLEAARGIGAALAAAARKRRVLIVASTDLSHYPPGDVADRVDRTTLAALAALDPGFFWLTNRFLINRALPHLSVTHCGEAALTAVLAAVRELGATEAVLIERLNSGDVVSERDYQHVVGYAALAFVKGGGPAPSGPWAEPLGKEERRELLAAARRAAEAALSGMKPSRPALSEHPRLNLPAAVSVALLEGGRERARSGSEAPRASLLEAAAEEAAAAARSARPALKPGELARLRLEIGLAGARISE